LCQECAEGGKKGGESHIYLSCSEAVNPGKKRKNKRLLRIVFGREEKRGSTGKRGKGTLFLLGGKKGVSAAGRGATGPSGDAWHREGTVIPSEEEKNFPGDGRGGNLSFQGEIRRREGKIRSLRERSGGIA